MSQFERWVRSQLEPLGIRFNSSESGSSELEIQVNHPRFYQRAALQGSLGFGESYADKDWDCEALDSIITRILQAKVPTGGLPHLWIRLQSGLLNMQTVLRAGRVARLHYDVDAEIFEWMLDPYLQYTCGYWKDAENLDDAQTAKMDMVVKKLGLQPGDELLDIGCGWGGFARYAAKKHGLKVSGLSISHSQLDYARASSKGLDCDFRYGDYRHLNEVFPQKFDAISIIGVTEHIGHKNYKTLYKVMRDQLKEGGLVLQHTISRMISTTHTEPFIDRYIFPGGMVPSVSQLSKAMAKYFVLEDVHNFGADYDPTLMAWYQRFRDAKPKVLAKKGFGERFYRIWKYYLLSCAGLFRAREAQLMQYVLSPKGVRGGYRRLG